MLREHDHDDDLERPRAPSPWDPFLPSPPNEPAPVLNKHFRNGIPRLVPEVEEGNVEYKLKLTHISPARFARLVTQLKWRLLEGHGQAYYELGVADSGALIGLVRADLDASLATLEEMAAEIGASVIVVKEIEVPPAVAALADAENGLLDGTGGWAAKMTKKLRLRADEDSTPVTTETEPGLEGTDDDEATPAESPLGTPAGTPRASPGPLVAPAMAARRLRSNPDRPSAQASPCIVPLDDDLALFAMEPEVPHHIDLDLDDDLALFSTEPEAPFRIDLDAPSPVPPSPDDDGGAPCIALDLGIVSVYKPLPVRRRVPAHAPVAPTVAVLHGKQARRAKYEKKGKARQPWHAQHSTVSSPGAAPAQTQPAPVPDKQETKAARRQIARDRRREERRQALLAPPEPAAELAPTGDAGAGALSLALADTVGHAADGDGDVSATAAITVVGAHVVQDATVELEARFAALGVSVDADVVPPAVAGMGEKEKGAEPRLIVEALVVRKMSIEEAYLDLAAFR